jgi:flagellar motor switch protein FliG
MSEEATATAEATTSSDLNLTGPQKAAILIMSVGTKSATEMMKSLTEKEIEQITLEIARMKNIRPEMVDSVLQEYYTLMEVKQYVINGGMDYAQQLLNELGGDSEKMMKKLRAQSGSTVFKEFQETKTSQIADFIRGEHPQVAALIFSQLRVEKTAEILALLDKEMQGEITYRLAMMESISPDVIDEIEEVIKEHMGGMDNLGDRVKSGTSIVAQILNGADVKVEKNVLEAIDERDPDVAQEIKEQMFLFEDIAHFDDKTIQIVINELDKQDMVLGLKGVVDEITSKFLSNMSSRAADMLREDMDALGPVPLKEVKDAQNRIIKKIKALEDAGQISTRQAGEEEVVE